LSGIGSGVSSRIVPLAWRQATLPVTRSIPAT
jgi:hypothetical protein